MPDLPHGLLDAEIVDALPPDERITVYIELTRLAEETKNQLDEIKARLTAMEGPLLEWFATTGTDAIRKQGRLARPRRDLYAKVAPGVERAQAAEALKRAGLDDYVKNDFNLTSLRALFIEWDKDSDAPPMPPELDGYFTTSEVYRLAVTR